MFISNMIQVIVKNFEIKKSKFFVIILTRFNSIKKKEMDREPW